MLPWGHAAVGYLLYSGSERRAGRRPAALAAIVAVVAAQGPDLVDKPLAWTVPVLPNGRSLAHSLLTGLLIVGALALLLAALQRRHLVAPLLVGWFSHPVADAFSPLVHWNPQYLGFLAWPVVPPLDYDGPKSFVGHFAQIDPLAPLFLFQLVLVASAAVLWLRDGRPGLALVRSHLGLTDAESVPSGGSD